jgi:mRNA-degrading endonuclease RelE of RelBE toxin-antitoxin system
MRYEIVLTDTAKEHYGALDARGRALIKDGLDDHLAHEPMKVSRSRIKRLREMDHPEFRLRLDPYRVFCDVVGQTVVVLAIVPKDETIEWLNAHGVKSS